MKMLDSKIILSKYRTPYFVIDKSILLKQYSKVRSVCDEVAYSVKANPNKGVIQALKEQDASFTVSSIEELLILKKLDVNPEYIHFYYPGANTAVFKQAVSLGIRIFVVDSEQHFNNLLKSIDGTKVSVFFRFRPSKRVLATHELPDMGIEKIQLIKLIRKAQANKNILAIGIHNHLITQNMSITAFKSMLLELTTILDIVKSVSVVNLGGGIPIKYDEQVFDFNSYSSLIRQFSSKFPTLRIILEPGRYIVGPAGSIVTSVRIVEKNCIWLDASVYNAYPDIIMLGIDLPCYSISNKPKKSYKIRGKTPCATDIFKKKVDINGVKDGDYVVFSSAGAYNFSTGLLNLKKPKTVLIDGIADGKYTE